MNAVPYDVMTLGNNEFEGDHLGPRARTILFDRIHQARFPVLCANVFYHSDGRTIVQPYKIFYVDGVRIGVFGLTTPRIAFYPSTKGFDVHDPIETAKEMVAELKDKADFVIALTHLGYDYGTYACDLRLAAQVPGIDVIIGGDSHTWLPKPTLVPEGKDSDSPFYVGGTIVDQTGEWGVAVGELDLRLRLDGGHRYRVMSYSTKTIDVDSTEAPAKDVDAILARFTAPLQDKAADLNKDISKPEMAAWLAKCLRETAGTQVALVSPDDVEDGLKAGGVTYLALHRMYPYPAVLIKTSETGKRLKEMLAKEHRVPDGAKVIDGRLYVGDQEAVDTRSYTLAYLSSKPHPDSTDLTVWDMVANYLNKHASN